jgi:heterodisulfide reductase subunit A-like polyferredoxin
MALPVTKDEDGFILDDDGGGIIAAGVARRPEDVHSSVRDATGAVARAYATALRRA